MRVHWRRAEGGIEDGLDGGADQASGLPLPALSPRSRLPRGSGAIEDGESVDAIRHPFQHHQ